MIERAVTLRLLCALLGGAGILVLAAGCDTGISGDAFDNQLPDTELSVRDSSLVDNLTNAERLSSTIFASWTGTDPDVHPPHIPGHEYCGIVEEAGPLVRSSYHAHEQADGYERTRQS